MADSYTREVFTDSPEQTAAAFGTLDANIRAVEDAFGAVIRSEDTDRTDGSRIVITAQSEHDAELAASAVTALLSVSSKRMSVPDRPAAAAGTVRPHSIVSARTSANSF